MSRSQLMRGQMDVASRLSLPRSGGSSGSKIAGRPLAWTAFRASTLLLPQNCSEARVQRIPTAGAASKTVSAIGIEDRTLMVKISLAKMSGSLDLSWRGLHELPEDIFELEDLEELTLAGNFIKELPSKITKFKSLKRLQAAGNQLSYLPPEITQLTELEEIWLHGNLLEALPEDIGALTKLWRLSLAGNRLVRLPPSLGALSELREVNLSGNLLGEVPAFIGNFEKLATLSMNGNWVERVPPELGSCKALRFLNLQTNHIKSLPAEIAHLEALEELNLSDNELTDVPLDWSGLTACKMIWLYGNALVQLPRHIFSLPELECIWLEGNPLDQSSLSEQLEDVIEDVKHLREIGLDLHQVEGLEVVMENRVWARVRLGEVLANSRGYFKLRRGGDIHHSPDHALVPKVLVVTFASAPGTPNWGGVLNRIAADAKPEEKCFDILYVCDGGRNWYSAGDDGIFYWKDKLKRITQHYSRVLMLGDSMGATAALLFADLATSVQVFTPQVDLSGASMRPGQPQPWLSKIKQRIIDSVRDSEAHIQCHVGTWEHDLEQAKLLPEKCELVIHHVDSHRLAFALNRESKLVPTIRAAIMKELGLYRAPRLVNLL